MSSLDDFLHRGILPFVGRAEELQRLVEFWRATPYAQGLRAVLVRAEAGIGKSRLLDETIRRVIAEEGAVVHMKLYPESSVSLAPLLAPALWHSNVGRELLRTEPEATLPSVITALRRLSRLRPTLLVLEDTHLLPSESTPELASLLNALADETISLLCLCRPTEWRGSAVLEGYVVERIELEGLSKGAIREMWEMLFGSGCEPEVAEGLHDATRGNALALRSVIRSAVDSGVIVRSGEGWRLNNQVGTFQMLMRRNVEILSAGMVAHLSSAELSAAGRLASLGEVFARETAGTMLENIAESAGDMLDTLMARGIISTTPMLPSPIGGIPPIPGVQHPVQFPVSAHPLLAFTHTLLHKYLAEHAEIDAASLVNIISGACPLYSVLPFILAHRHGSQLRPDMPGLDMAAERSLYSAWLLDRAHDSSTGLQVWETAAALVEIVKDELPQDKRERWPFRLLQIRMSLCRHLRGEEREESVRRFHDATLHAEPGKFLSFRLVALSYLLDIRSFQYPELYLTVWEEMTRIAAEFPEHRCTDPYFQCLGAIANSASLRADFEMASRIRKEVEMLEMETDPATVPVLRWRLYPPLLAMYSTQEELDDRTAMYARLEETEARLAEPSSLRRAAFLTHCGKMKEMLDVVDTALGIFQMQGDHNGIMYVTLDQMMARSALGWDLAEIESGMRHMVAGLVGPDRESVISIAGWVGPIGLLRGDVEWGWRLCNEFSAEGNAQSVPRILLLIARGEMSAAAALLGDEWPRQLLLDMQGYEALRALLGVLLYGGEDVDTAIAQVEELLRRPMLRLYDILVVGAVIHVLEELRSLEGLADRVDALRPLIRDYLDTRLAWLAERELGGFMEPLLERNRGYLSPEDLRKWSAAISTIVAHRDTGRPRDGVVRKKVRVSMLGTIQVAPTGGEMAALRGVRIRTLLGLMVADQMIGSSLTPQEFVLLAGEDNDPELARKKRNMGVVRLREIMGADAILTDGRTPRLNPDLVDVDLLHADDVIKRSLAAAREGAWLRAHPLLMEALELTRGDVPFPTLYESFFEAARDDFEFRLRSAILDVARGLLREGDTGGAEEILRRAFAAMSDDEEIAELLREALIARGNRVEAERIRLRAKEAAL